MKFLKWTVFTEGGMALIALLFICFFSIDAGIHFQFNGYQILTAGGAALILLAGYFILRLLPFSGLRNIEQIVRDVFRQYMSGLSLQQLAAVSLLAGIGEELLFRGFMQSGLCKISLPAWLSILLTSLLFGLAHAVTLTYFLLACVISIYLGWLLVWTDNMFVPIAVHALYDFFILLFIRQTTQNPSAAVSE
ncbi:MAG: CPBP family intramembrane metalloprotease [Planctomycetaceae bacterium]|jgi:membrane protease YdiL (CAAX protease family)|nr:CPBP family intramembrane metalloprotease [Planctomycetaceae bacterium]